MPHKGINALDGLLLAYQAISNLRQHIRDEERIHGIITEGGQAPNIVPDRATGNFYVRAATEQRLAALKPRVQACFEAGAQGSGAEVEVRWAGVDYLDLNTNSRMPSNATVNPSAGSSWRRTPSAAPAAPTWAMSATGCRPFIRCSPAHRRTW